MKKLLRFTTAIAIAVTMLFAAGTAAMAYSPENTAYFSQTGYDTQSVTVKVDLSTYPQSVAGWAIYDVNDSSNTVLALDTVLTKSITIPSYNPGYSSTLKLMIKLNSGSTVYYYTDVSTKPAQMLKASMSLNIYPSLGKANLYGVKDQYATGLQFQKVAVNTGKSVTYTTTALTEDFTVTKNVPYKFRARNYYDNASTGERYYGSYSGYKYFLDTTCYYGNNMSKNGINIKLKGIKNVKYKIYVATSSEGTYKLTRTVTPSAGKSVTYLVNKRGTSTMSKGKTYYFKIIPYISGNKSDTYIQFSAYNY